jgi:molybdopterin/thiamine biosynthesis adenylyltransferase
MTTFKMEYITRHLDLINLDSLKTKIVIVGAGAIGSFTALSLAKMGFSDITVYDFDTVENENIGSQFFSIDSIGKPKVEALQTMIKAFTGIEIRAVNAKVETMADKPAHIVIAAVDNMAVRRMIFETCNCRVLIDPRMGAEFATMSVVDFHGSKAQIDSYKKTLFSDSSAVQERCTAKTTIYTVLLIAGQVVKAVKDTLGNSEARVRTLDWNIGQNALLAFGEKGRL